MFIIVDLFLYEVQPAFIEAIIDSAPRWAAGPDWIPTYCAM